jgi:hypothetical protein
MSWISDVVAGTTITALWGNSIRNTGVSTHASSAARTSAITAPSDGMASWLQDVDRLDIYDSANWIPYLCVTTWGQRTTTSTSTTTEVGVLRIDSVSLKANRSYRIWTSPLFLLSSTTGDVVTGRIRVNTAGTATTASTARSCGPTTGANASGQRISWALREWKTPTCWYGTTPSSMRASISPSTPAPSSWTGMSGCPATTTTALMSTGRNSPPERRPP